MNRKEFIKTCGFACVGSLTLSTFLQSCSSVKTVNGTIKGGNIFVPLSDIKSEKEGEIIFTKYVILQNEQLQYPICVYRIDDENYNALLMKCTHQGTELTAYGDKLQCSSHGSEFDKNGNATNGPATNQLRKFPVIKENDQLKISLKSV